MACFVLVHGGGHGGWCYKKVARLLRIAGHDVYTPTLTGLGERQRLLTAATDLSTHICDIVNSVIYEDLNDIILVGHSYGGMVITGVADRLPGRIRELVYLDAAHLFEGESLVDVAPISMSFARSSSRVVDGVELAMWLSDAMIEAMGVTDAEDVALLRTKMLPHPWKCFAEPLRLSNNEAMKKIPRTNINCSANLRAGPDTDHSRQTAGHRNFEIDTGHDLMITEPQKVTAMLLDVAAI